MTSATDLVQRLNDEADLCANEGASDIAHLLWEAAKALQTAQPAVVAPAEPLLAEERVERAGRAIFEHWAFGAPVAWVEHGNSDMQDKARRFARTALAMDEATRATHPSAPPAGYAQPLTEFREGQWWVKELDAMVKDASPDQKRAVAVVHHMLRAALSAVPSAPASKDLGVAADAAGLSAPLRSTAIPDAACGGRGE